MRHDRQNGFGRIPVPRTFAQRVAQLENRDSVMFESLSLPSLPSIPGLGSRGSEHRQTAPAIDLGDDFISDDETTDTSELQLRALLDRVHELESETRQKDAEIAHLRELLARHIARPDPFRERYETVKLLYDKLKEALALEGRIRRVRLKSVRQVKLAD
jgi:hypothetical protein